MTDYPITNIKTPDNARFQSTMDENGYEYHRRINPDGSRSPWRSPDRDILSVEQEFTAQLEETSRTLGERLDIEKAEVTTQLAQIAHIPDINEESNNAIVIEESLDSPTVIQLKGGNFNIPEPITIDGTKDIVIQGQGVDKTVLEFEKLMFTISNTSKEEKSITQNIDIGDQTIYLNNTLNINEGDLITVNTNERMEETTRTQNKNHTAIVTRVLQNSIVVDHPVPTSFNVSGTPSLIVYPASGKVVIKDMTLLFDYVNSTTGLYTIETNAMIKPEFRNLKIVNTNKGYQGLTSDGKNISVFRFTRCLYPLVENVEFDSVNYGVMPTSATIGTKVIHSSAQNSRHLVAPTGGAQKTKVIDCETFNCYAGFDSHQTAYDTDHINCTSYGDEVENKFRGRSDYIQNCYFSGGLEVDNDIGLNSSTKNLMPIEKTITHSRFEKIFNTKTSVNVYINDVISMGNVAVQTVKDNVAVLNSTFSSGETGSVSFFPRGKNVKIDNVKLQGKTKGVDKTDNSIDDSGTAINFNLSSSNFNSIHITNVEIDGFTNAFSFPSSFSALNKEVVIRDVFVKNTTTALETASNYKDFLRIENISFINGHTFSNDINRFRYPIISKTMNNKVAQGNAIPTIGTWNRGDKVMSTTSGTTGWVCTEGGSPGTWTTI